MIKLKVSLFNDQAWMSAFGTLSSNKSIVGVTLWRLLPPIKKIQEEIKSFVEVNKSIIDKYKIPDGTRIEKLKGEAAKAIKDLYAQEIELPINKKVILPMDATGLSANDLILLSDFIEPPEVKE